VPKICGEKLKNQLQRQQFDGSKEEQHDDSDGIFLLLAAYEDVARQGVL
jgi:hypothetical protein